MDVTNRRPQLPALSYLDIDRPKREEDEHTQRGPSGQHAYQDPPAASPSHPYTTAPPMYGHPPPQSANTWHGASVQTPPESRRTSGEDCGDHIKLQPRQSLPSISEALGVDNQTYTSATSTSQPPSQSTHLSHQSSAAPASPTIGAKRSFGTMEPSPNSAYTNGSSARFPSFREEPTGSQSYRTPDANKSTYAPPPDPRPPLHLQTSQPPSQSQHSERYSTSQTTSPQYAQTSSHSGGSMGPPTSFTYGYAPYPPRYTQPTTSSQSAGPVYQPSSHHAPPSTPSSSWKFDNTSSRYASEDGHGDFVKRHLDLHDLENALNEIAQTSSIMHDFSRRYGDRMHQTARSGPTYNTLPSMVEVEDMISKARTQQESLNKIREVIFAQQAAYEQQMADQRQQHKAYHEPPPLPNEQSRDLDEMKGGFAGADTKKRRGRAAPPGRCHSCNRAETPEWRRGPDGARTLCNACGLHYAKLTRKQTGANKAAVGSSNLRPKEP